MPQVFRCFGALGSVEEALCRRSLTEAGREDRSGSIGVHRAAGRPRLVAGWAAVGYLKAPASSLLGRIGVSTCTCADYVGRRGRARTAKIVLAKARRREPGTKMDPSQMASFGKERHRQSRASWLGGEGAPDCGGGKTRGGGGWLVDSVSFLGWARGGGRGRKKGRGENHVLVPAVLVKG